MSQLARWSFVHRRVVAVPTRAGGAILSVGLGPVSTSRSRWHGSVAQAVNSCCEKRWQGVRTHSTLSRSKRGKPSRYIQTLNPEKLHSAGQQILTLSGNHVVHVRFNEQLASNLGLVDNHTVRTAFHPTVKTPFPPEAEGVYYYDNDKAQVRFRLCKTLEDFAAGSDLMGPDSSPWNMPLAKMARNHSTYGPFLALMKQEFPLKPQDVDPSHDMHRSVTTFSSQRLVNMDQRVFDISGYFRVMISPQGKAGVSLKYRHAITEGVPKYYPFPDNTVGVFYYHQSQTSPTRIGDLRFRLCSDVRSFDAGTDLLLPSGLPWCVDSHSLSVIGEFKSIREYLVEEGLLERDVYPGVPDSMLSVQITPLTSFKQPFAVDLSVMSFTSVLISPTLETPPHHIPLQYIFRKYKDQPLFSGRAVVCLEPYPDLPMTPHRHRPLVAIRILEFLTPMRRLSTDDVIHDPTPGEWIMHRYRNQGQYVPWGYTPRKAEHRAALAAWIDAQSTSPPLES